MLLGGTPFSKLFLSVRDALGLTYYCESSLDFFTGTIYVESGFSKGREQMVLDAVLVQIQALISGDITEEQFLKTKLFIRNKMLSYYESAALLEEWCIDEIIQSNFRAPRALAEEIEILTLKEVKEVASKLEVTAKYVLYAQGEEVL